MLNPGHVASPLQGNCCLFIYYLLYLYFNKTNNPPCSLICQHSLLHDWLCFQRLLTARAPDREDRNSRFGFSKWHHVKRDYASLAGSNQMHKNLIDMIVRSLFTFETELVYFPVLMVNASVCIRLLCSHLVTPISSCSLFYQ